MRLAAMEKLSNFKRNNGGSETNCNIPEKIFQKKTLKRAMYGCEMDGRELCGMYP